MAQVTEALLWRVDVFSPSYMAAQVFVPPLEVAQRGGDGYFGMAMLNMATSCFSDDVCFYPSCSMGLDGYGLWRASVSSAAVCVTSSAGEILVIYSELERVPLCWRLFMMLYWACKM